MFCYFGFDRHTQAFKRKNDRICQNWITRLLAFVLPRISRLTGHYQSGDDELKTLMRVMRAYSNIKVTFALFLADNLETLFAAVFGVNMSLSWSTECVAALLSFWYPSNMYITFVKVADHSFWNLYMCFIHLFFDSYNDVYTDL